MKNYSRNYQGKWKKTPGRVLGIFFIRVYQLTLSSYVGGHCRHIPSCSEYAYEAVAKYGLARGVWLSARRLARCHPFTKLGGKDGYDPVP